MKMNPKQRETGNDEIYTPSWAAQEMVEYFRPTGTILEPCKGGGAFTDLLPGCLWCEINEGKDFFEFHEKVDWIITNPPFSLLRQFVLHSMKISNDIVFLIPIWKFFMAYGLMEQLKLWGGIVEIRWYGTGSKLDFPMGNAIGAIHLRRNYTGEMKTSFYNDPNL